MAATNRVDSFAEDNTSASSPNSADREKTVVGSEDVESAKKPSRHLSWLFRWLSNTAHDTEQTEDEDIDEYCTITRSLDEWPTGYPKVAAFQSSDRNFMLYRGFKSLHCRILSGVQHEVEQLEQELEQLDRADNTQLRSSKLESKTRDERECPVDSAAGNHPLHVSRSRPTVLWQLRAKLLEYDEFLLKAREMYSLQRPSDRDYESVRVWFQDEEPIVRREAQFIRRKEDIITLRTGRECAGFDSLVERCLGRTDEFFRKWLRCHIIQYLFLTPELRKKCSDGNVRLYTPARVDALVNLIITVVIFILLVLPVIVMYEITNIGEEQSALDAIGVLIVFTLIFGMAISTLTTARRQELFGASAAYCAVLVVFISNFGVQQVEIND